MSADHPTCTQGKSSYCHSRSISMGSCSKELEPTDSFWRSTVPKSNGSPSGSISWQSSGRSARDVLPRSHVVAECRVHRKASHFRASLMGCLRKDLVIRSSGFDSVAPRSHFLESERPLRNQTISQLHHPGSGAPRPATSSATPLQHSSKGSVNPAGGRARGTGHGDARSNDPGLASLGAG